MSRAALVAMLLLAGCAGSGDPDEPATMVVTARTNGVLSMETFDVDGGRLEPGELEQPHVYAHAGDEEPEEGISFEEIYLVEPGGEPRRLTNDRRFDHSPTLLRDGSVAFVSCPIRPGTSVANCSLDAIQPESGKRRTIAGDLGFVGFADLSPDEQRLLLSRVVESTGAVDMTVRDLESGEEQQLGAGSFGRWSPDGKRIAFASDRDQNGLCVFRDCSGFASEVYVMDASGANVRRLTTHPSHEAVADWSGDGKWVVFGRITDENDDWDLWAVRADGECEVQLTDTTRSEIGAEWFGTGGGGLDC